MDLEISTKDNLENIVSIAPSLRTAILRTVEIGLGEVVSRIDEQRRYLRVPVEIVHPLYRCRCYRSRLTGIERKRYPLRVNVTRTTDYHSVHALSRSED